MSTALQEIGVTKRNLLWVGLIAIIGVIATIYFFVRTNDKELTASVHYEGDKRVLSENRMTHDNYLKLKEGMPLEEVLVLLGHPMNVAPNVFGTVQTGRIWVNGIGDPPGRRRIDLYFLKNERGVEVVVKKECWGFDK